MRKSIAKILITISILNCIPISTSAKVLDNNSVVKGSINITYEEMGGFLNKKNTIMLGKKESGSGWLSTTSYAYIEDGQQHIEVIERVQSDNKTHFTKADWDASELVQLVDFLYTNSDLAEGNGDIANISDNDDFYDEAGVNSSNRDSYLNDDNDARALRDLCLYTLFKKSESNKSFIDDKSKKKLIRILEGDTPTYLSGTTVIVSQLGFTDSKDKKEVKIKDMATYVQWLNNLEGSKVNEVANEVQKDFLKTLGEKDYDKLSERDKILEGLRLLTDNSSSRTDMSSYREKLRKYYKDKIDDCYYIGEEKDRNGANTPIVKVMTAYSDTEFSEDDAKVANYLFHLAKNSREGSTELVSAAYAVVLGKGSEYSYHSKNTRLLTIDEESYLKEVTDTSAGNAKIANDIAKEANSIIDKNTNLSNEQLERSLILYRLKYGYYMSQTKESVSGGKLDEFCYSELYSPESYTRQILPIPYSEPPILNLRGYVYVWNAFNDMEDMGSVIIPALGGLAGDTLKSKASTAEVLMLCELKKCYDFSLTNMSGEVAKVMEEIWTKDRIIDKDAGTKKSLQKLYEELEATHAELPDFSSLTEDTDENPLKSYINVEEQTVNNFLRQGIELSSTYIPLKTNVYDTITYKPFKDDAKFFVGHALYGYNRKALYIDTDVSSVSSLYTTGKSGNKKVATLKDVLECNKEVALYTDDNFYNCNKLEEYSKQAIDRLDNVDSSNDNSTKDKSWLEGFQDSFKDLVDTNILDILKTGDKDTYPTRLSKVDTYSKTKETNYKPSSKYDNVLLKGSDIDEYLSLETDDYSYNVMRGFAVTSAVYRYKALFDIASQNTCKPIFLSSSNVVYMSGADQQWSNTYFNYILLKNIQDETNINYKTNLDMNKPVYIDIYGNIVTESGVVVVPAACNATLNSNYTPLTMGFLYYYGKKESIPTDLNFVETITDSECFEKSEKTGNWEIANKVLNSVVNLNKLSTADADTQLQLINHYDGSLLSKGGLDFNRYVTNVFLEVMRGAPISSIDKEFEGLLLGGRVTRSGIERAAKLELFRNAMCEGSQGALSNISNLLLHEKLAYIILILFKVALSAIVILLMSRIVKTAFTEESTIKFIISLFLTVACTVTAIFAVPWGMNFTYYESNKYLLQDEVTEIAILNLEKRESGMEVGVSQVTEPEKGTSLYLHLKDVDIPYWQAFYDIALSNLDKTLENILDKYRHSDLAFSQKQFEFRGDGLYISIENLFDSANITFNPNRGTMYAYTATETPASFYTPYYVFMKKTVENVNKYNLDTGIKSYTTQTYKGGRVKSLGISESYFNSDTFIEDEDYDLMGLLEIYNIDTTKADTSSSLSNEELEQVRNSIWYNGNATEKQVRKRIEKLDAHIKRFVADRKDLLGRVSDETFIKALSLDAALYYNKIFNIGYADGIEIYDLGNDDVVRLSTADIATTIECSPLSYTRFIYDVGGEPSIVAAAVLECITYVDNIVEPLAMLFIFIVMFISLYYYRIFKSKGDSSLSGYFLITFLLYSTNIISSLLTKFTMCLPGWGVPMFGCLCIICVFKILRIFVISYIVALVIINIKDLGAARLMGVYATINARIKDISLPNIRGLNLREKWANRSTHGKDVYTTMHDADEIRSYTTDTQNYNNFNQDYINDYGRRVSEDYDRRTENYNRQDVDNLIYQDNLTRERENVNNNNDDSNSGYRNRNHRSYRDYN